MPERATTANATLERARTAAGACRDCSLYRDATQVVFADLTVAGKLLEA